MEELIPVTADHFDANQTNTYYVSRFYYGDTTPGMQRSWADLTYIDAYRNEDDPVLFEIPHTAHGHYSESGIAERSNFEYLSEHFSEYVVIIGHSMHDGQMLALIAGSQVPEELLDLVEGLQHEVVVNYDHMYEVEERVIEEEYGYRLRGALLGLLPASFGELPEAELYDMFRAALAEVEIIFETPDSVWVDMSLVAELVADMEPREINPTYRAYLNSILFGVGVVRDETVTV